MNEFLPYAMMTAAILAIPTAIIYAILSFIVKGIIESKGYKVTYLVTQYFYENRILKSIENNNRYYRLIRKTYYIVNIILISLIGLAITFFILMTIFI